MLRYRQPNLGIRTAANTPPIQETLTSNHPNSNAPPYDTLKGHGKRPL